MSSLQKGLVGHWTMDQKDIDNGRVRDQSPYDHHGYNRGGPSFSSGIVGETAYDNTAGNSTGVELLRDADARKYDDTFSWSLWFKSTTTSGDQYARIISRDCSEYFCLYVDQTQSDPQSTNYGGSFSVNDWHHLGVQHFSDTSVEIWIDGQNVASGGSAKNISSFRPWVIGGNTEGNGDISGNHFVGKIDDVRLYNEILSESKINLIKGKRTKTGIGTIGTSLKVEVYDTETYYNNNGHPSTKSEMDEFYDTSNSGINLEKEPSNFRSQIFFSSSNQQIDPFGYSNDYPYYLNRDSGVTTKDNYSWKVEETFTAPETGTYTFAIDSDDSSDILIDGSKVVSIYGLHGFENDVRNNTGSISLTKDVEYNFTARFEDGGGEDGFAVGWQKPSDSSYSLFPLDILLKNNNYDNYSITGNPKITAELYDIKNYGGVNYASTKSELDELFDTSNSGVNLEKQRDHFQTHIFFGSGGQSTSPLGTVNDYPYYINVNDKDDYSWKIEGSFVAPETGTYTFAIDSDDASDVLIDGNMVTSFYGGHAFDGDITNHTGTISLTKDVEYSFSARLQERGAGDGIAVGWKKPSDGSYSLFPLKILS